MSYRKRLIYVLLLLTVFPLLVFIILQCNNTIQQSLKMSNQGIQKIVEKDTELLDIFFTRVEQSGMNAVINPSLFDSLDISLDTDYDNIYASKYVNRALSSIFIPYYDSIGYQLITNRYVFGSTYPKIDINTFWKSSIAKQTVENDGKGIWHTTFDAYENFSGMQVDKTLDIDSRNVISYSVMLDIQRLESSVLQKPKGLKQNPILMITLSEDNLYRLLETNYGSTQEDILFYILDEDNTILSCADKQLLRQRLSDDWTNTIWKQNSGGFVSGKGKDRNFIIYDTSKNTGWKIVALLPYGTIAGPVISESVRSFVTITCLLLVVMVAAVMFLSFYLSKPLQTLIRGIQKSSTGDFSYVIDRKRVDKEFRDLYHHYNRMNQKISELINENYSVKLREKENEVMMLNLQLNPHFIFNTLNTINWIAIDNDQQQISSIIQCLCTMMEYNFRHKKDQSQLFNDIIWLRSYCWIMQQRYDNLFTVEYDIPPALVKQAVPKLFLQPLVENAILHAFRDKDAGGLIRISAASDTDVVTVTVSDNGCGMSLEDIHTVMTDTSGKSIGVLNVHHRIQLLYGKPFGLTIESQETTGVPGTTVYIRLPRRDLPDDEFHFSSMNF